MRPPRLHPGKLRPPRRPVNPRDAGHRARPLPIARPHMPNSSRIVPVILSGGSGTRLWPVSRESFPKQFWPLLSHRSMIEETARRALGDGFAAPMVVCNQEHRFLIAEQMRNAGASDAAIVLEPVGRNS